jgi:hypothetical protein
LGYDTGQFRVTNVFEEPCASILQGASDPVLKMEPEGFPKTLVITNEITRRHNPEETGIAQSV